MIVYLPHYDNGQDYSDYDHGIEDIAYFNYEDAVKHVKSKGFIIEERDDLPDLMGDAIPIAFYSEKFEEKYWDDRPYMYINEIQVSEKFEEDEQDE